MAPCRPSRQYVQPAAARQPHFANARSIRNALDRIRLRHATRLFSIDAAPTREQLCTLRRRGHSRQPCLRQRRIANGRLRWESKAFIFDVDGTIADTEEAHRVAFNLAFEHHGLGWRWEPAEYRQLLRVAGGKERIRRYIEGLDINGAPERARLFSMVRELHADKTRFYAGLVRDGGVRLRPGVARLMAQANSEGYKLAIASTTTAANIDALLQATLGDRGIDMFAVIACGDQVSNKKPAPDIYHLALRGLGLQAEHAIAFEDSTNGLHAATAAGLWTVVTPNFWTQDNDFSGAGLLLPHLGEPDDPLVGEPGLQLDSAAWLTCHDAVRLAEHANTPLATH